LGVGSAAGPKAVPQGKLGDDPSEPVLNAAAFGTPLLAPATALLGTALPCSATGFSRWKRRM